MTAAEAVLTELRRARGEFVCARVLVEVAGWRAAARVHDLRADGHDIQTGVCQCQTCQGARKRAAQRGKKPAHLGAYRLVTR